MPEDNRFLPMSEAVSREVVFTEELRKTRLFDHAIVGNAREAVEFITNILESSTEYSVVGTDLNGKILLWNEGARLLYGYEPEEVVGKANSSILHTPEDVRAGRHREIMETALRDGKWEGTIGRIRKDGTRFTARVVITPRRDTKGKAIGYLLISKDISAEIRLTEELKATQFYARSLIEASLDPLVTISSEGIITDVNEASIQVTGFTREQLIGTDFSDYFTEPEKAREGYQQVFSQGFVRDYSLAIRHVSGSVRDVLYNASVYKDDKGKVLGVFAAARDETERKRYEQSLQEASRMKSEFLANMSHELRTPLNGIIGFAEFLIDGKPGSLNPKQKEYLGDILSSGSHLLQLINDVLDLAKVEAGKMELNAENFSLAMAIDEVRAVAKPMAQKKNIRITIAVDPLLEQVELDQQKFKQVLYNLLSNGIKFTDDAGSVEISAAPIESNCFRLSVKDTGIGIREEDLGRLFREFEQLETGASRRYEGTGLGLALTRKLVELQGGKITVASKLGEGSTFSVVLPIHLHGAGA